MKRIRELKDTGNYITQSNEETETYKDTSRGEEGEASWNLIRAERSSGEEREQNR